MIYVVYSLPVVILLIAVMLEISLRSLTTQLSAISLNIMELKDQVEDIGSRLGTVQQLLSQVQQIYSSTHPPSSDES